MLAFKIAVRYLFSKKSHGVVNIISAISVVGVALAAMAIVVVLSVFNGFTDLAASNLAVLDPDVKIVPAKGKVITNPDSISALISDIRGVENIDPVIEERALAIYNNVQMPIIIKGIPDGYAGAAGIDSVLIDGEYMTSIYDRPAAQISPGVSQKLMARPGLQHLLQLYVPRRVGRINPANPATAFRDESVVITGVFQVGQSEYDSEHVFIPLDCARTMLDYPTEATALEVKLAPGTDPKAFTAKAEALLSDAGCKALTRLQQQQASFRMIQIEKWVTFLMLAFILVIASFNIISTLSLLVIEKRSNMETLRALGAPKGMVRAIFIWQGWLISIAGGFFGIVLGTLLALGQQHYGWISLAGDPSMMVIKAYPVHVIPADIAIVFFLVVVVGLLTSQITRFFCND